ncbi:MAG TPA: hypothetical protein VHW09_26065 [Bryobacteraceae bacterium]|nr:hypothetical protein [Bryobacteraceae bacterium]
MKIQVAISALFTAAVFLTPAQATTTLFAPNPLTTPLSDIKLYTAASGGTLTSDYLTATVGYTGGLPGTVTQSGPPTTETLNETHSTTLGVNSNGVGLSNNSDEIGPTDFAIVNFSNAATYNNQGAVSASLSLKIEATEPQGTLSDWVVYGLSTPTSTSGTLLAWGQMSSLGNVTSASYGSLSDLAYYSAYAIGIIGDCEISITGATVTYSGTTTQSTPEPGTFVMGGMALIGLGVTMKRRNRKA